MDSLWEDFVEWLIRNLMAIADTVTQSFMFAFSPQLQIFSTVFFPFQEFAAVLNYAAVAIALALVLFYIFLSVFMVFSKEYVNPFNYIVRFGLFLTLLYLGPTIMAFTLDVAGAAYWTIAEATGIVTTIDEDEDFTNDLKDLSSQIADLRRKKEEWKSDSMNWAGLTGAEKSSIIKEKFDDPINELIKQLSDKYASSGANSTYWSEVQAKTLEKVTTGGYGDVTDDEQADIDESAEAMADKYKSLKVGWLDKILAKFTGEDLEAREEEREQTLALLQTVNPQIAADAVKESFTLGIVASLLTLMVAFKYLGLLITLAERYVFIGILIFLYPIFLIPITNKNTSHVTKNYFRALGGQLIIQTLSMMFICILSIVISSTAGGGSAGSDTTYMAVTNTVSGKVLNVGGTFLWVCLMLGFVNVIGKLENLFNSLGWSVGASASNLGTQALGFATGLGFTIGRAATGAVRHREQGKSSGSGGGKGAGGSGSTTQGGFFSSGAKAQRAENKAFSKAGEAASKNPGKAVSGVSLENLSPQAQKSALGQVAANGGAGLAGKTGSQYAGGVFRDGKGLIPENAAINSASIDNKGNGQVNYTDSNGKSHTVGLSNEPPKNGVYSVGQDATGEAVYRQEMGTKGLGIQNMDNAMESGLFNGADSDTVKSAFGADDNSMLMFDSASGKYSLLDESGNTLATDLDRGFDTSSLGMKDDGDNKAVQLQTENGELISGFRDDSNKQMLNNYQNADGTGMTFDKEATAANGEKTWAYTHKDSSGDLVTESIGEDQARSIQAYTKNLTHAESKGDGQKMSDEDMCKFVDSSLENGYSYSGNSFEAAFKAKFGDSIDGKAYTINADAAHFNKFDSTSSATAVLEFAGEETGRLVTISATPSGGGYKKIKDKAGKTYYVSSISKGANSKKNDKK